MCCEIQLAIIEARIIVPRGYSGKFSKRQCKIQLPMDNVGEQKVLESFLVKFSKSLKSKILTTMVPFPGYTEFITNLPG